MRGWALYFVGLLYSIERIGNTNTHIIKGTDSDNLLILIEYANFHRFIFIIFIIAVKSILFGSNVWISV